MDYRLHLQTPISLKYVDILAREILMHPADFDIVYQLMFDPEEKVAWRAAWACQKISEKMPEWFTPQKTEELISLSLSTKVAGLLRGCLGILNNLQLPQNMSVDFINACFEWMISPEYPIAIQAYSMKILYKICLIEPGFIPEFRAYLENANPVDYSAGFISSRKNILKLLNAI